MSSTELAVIPWPARAAPTEAAIRRDFATEGLVPYRWSSGPGDIYRPHRHVDAKVLYVVEGAITFGFSALGQRLLMREGDRLDLPPGIMHDAVVGPAGVVCLEAHRA